MLDQKLRALFDIVMEILTTDSKCSLLNHVRLFVTPWTLARQAPLSLEFSRQACWSGLPFRSPEDSDSLAIVGGNLFLPCSYVLWLGHWQLD